MNMNLYGHAGAWLMVDCGLILDRKRPRAVVVPDPKFCVQHRERLAGLVLTHAHLDHIGAVAHLWPRVRCPIYATPFTATLLLRQVKTGIGEAEAALRIVRPGVRYGIGPFDVEWIILTHSTLEPGALVIRTPAGTVLHTGDWKLDETPVLGDAYDLDRIRRLARPPVLAMVCDSTNALVEGRSGSEAILYESLRALIAPVRGRVLVTCFASNVARLTTIARVARATGRRLTFIGRALEETIGAARACGYWNVDVSLVPSAHVGYLPPEEVLAVVTGSQGEPDAVLARLVADTHSDLNLDPGDTVIFSSRRIPGNEIPIDRLQERLRARGIRVLHNRNALTHVSGHPARDELRRMYDWVKPRIAIPTHGEPVHLDAHARLARQCGVRTVLQGRNGDLFRLAPGAPCIAGRVHSGHLCIEQGSVRTPEAPHLAP